MAAICRSFPRLKISVDLLDIDSPCAGQKYRWGGKQLTSNPLPDQTNFTEVKWFYISQFSYIYGRLPLKRTDKPIWFECKIPCIPSYYPNSHGHNGRCLWFSTNGSIRPGAQMAQAQWAILGLGGESRVTGAPVDPDPDQSMGDGVSWVDVT